MGQAKMDAIETLNRLPDEASWEEIMYELYVTKKVNQAREQVARGEFVTHEEAKKRLLKS
ncbi:hypothetical protein EDC19_1813 [Natranaerovirga hydrolytica]|uniref:Addiction module component n=1 Tax=Natranaerovirga hydrolytica TaxID=680378 RepID=A0A4R1MKT2_9FIRM|nr:hypothetical protein [Natranaerovirga hydrolytica]TCK92660.1 hypothetical protein EDC19_1813 [Natranaerovirga hydrolytica]